jgi:hypothetical protein
VRFNRFQKDSFRACKLTFQLVSPQLAVKRVFCQRLKSRLNSFSSARIFSYSAPYVPNKRTPVKRPLLQLLKAFSLWRAMVNMLEGIEALATVNCALNDRLVHSVAGVDAILLADGREPYSDCPKPLLEESREAPPLERRGNHR